jgi:hypothetical protein
MKLNMTTMQIQRHEIHLCGAEYKRARQKPNAYQLPAASWLNEGAPLDGTGGLLTNNLPIGAQPRKFFRFLLLEN